MLVTKKALDASPSTYKEHPLGAPTARQTFLEKQIGEIVSLFGEFVTWMRNRLSFKRKLAESTPQGVFWLLQKVGAYPPVYL